MTDADDRILDALSRSPALTGALRRAFGVDKLPFFEPYFANALQYGGDAEFGFEREPGVNFNPRAARVALILLSDGAEKDPVTVAAGISSAVMLPVSGAGSEVSTLAVKAFEIFQNLERFGLVTDERVKRIVIALAVDFLRHRHQILEDVGEPERTRLQVDTARELERQLVQHLQILHGWASDSVPGMAKLFFRWLPR